MKKVVKGSKRGIGWGLWERLKNLDFMNDIVFRHSNMNKELITLLRSRSCWTQNKHQQDQEDEGQCQHQKQGDHW
jgi:hypothetical protein